MTADAKLLLYSFSLETAAIGALFKGPYFLRIASFLTLHASACAIVSPTVWRLMPERYRHQRARTLALIFALLFTVSLAGFVSLVVINVSLLRSQKERPLLRAGVLTHDDLHPEVLAMPVRKMGEGALRLLASGNFVSQEARMRTVMMLHEITAEMPKHMRLLKESVRSHDDSVRMFSFGMVDAMEKRLNDQIHARLAQFKAAREEKDRSRAACELAALYWEYVYTGLADKEYRAIMMREAGRYAELALKVMKDDPVLLSILGRIALSERRYDDALRFFQNAMAGSPNPDKFLPYIAEIHYVRRDYAAVRKVFAEHSGFTHDPALAPLVSLWTGA